MPPRPIRLYATLTYYAWSRRLWNPDQSCAAGYITSIGQQQDVPELMFLLGHKSLHVSSRSPLRTENTGTSLGKVDEIIASDRKESTKRTTVIHLHTSKSLYSIWHGQTLISTAWKPSATWRKGPVSKYIWAHYSTDHTFLHIRSSQLWKFILM